MTLYCQQLPSPVGMLKLVACERGLMGVLWGQDSARRVGFCSHAMEQAAHPYLMAAQQQLAQYFARQRRAFSLPLHMVGTPFQQRVWRALLTMPYAQTCSYGELARQLGWPGAARAVGCAIGKNPLAIVVPCHRVIGAKRALTGFAGGIAAKQALLAHEGGQARLLLAGRPSVAPDA